MIRRPTYPVVVSTLALVVALVGVPGVTAGGILVTSKQIKNGAILTQDIHKAAVKSSDLGTNAVQSGDIKTGAVTSSDIGAGEVGPQDVTMPDPQQLVETDVASLDVGNDFVLIDSVGTYTKEDPAAVLQVDWTGTAKFDFGNVGCIFQLRIDGQPSVNGAGTVFVSGTESIAATALFAGVAPGPHVIEIWVRQTPAGPGTSRCLVGPASAGIAQTFVVSEQVL